MFHRILCSKTGTLELHYSFCCPVSEILGVILNFNIIHSRMQFSQTLTLFRRMGGAGVNCKLAKVSQGFWLLFSGIKIFLAL